MTEFANGGIVTGQRGDGDTVSALLDPGYVLPKPAEPAVEPDLGGYTCRHCQRRRHGRCTDTACTCCEGEG